MSMEIAKDVNALVNMTMQELLNNVTNKQGIMHTLEQLMTKRNNLEMENVVKRSYQIKHQQRINEITAEIRKEVAEATTSDGKPEFSNDTKRTAETQIRAAKNEEIIYLTKQIESDKELITKNDLIINNLRKLIEISLGLLKTL